MEKKMKDSGARIKTSRKAAAWWSRLRKVKREIGWAPRVTRRCQCLHTIVLIFVHHPTSSNRPYVALAYLFFTRLVK